jgi:hypothetical protein
MKIPCIINSPRWEEKKISGYDEIIRRIPKIVQFTLVAH